MSTISGQSDSLITRLLAANPSLFDSITRNRESMGVQVIYTRVDRDRKGKASFTDHFYGDAGRYFYPASTVKLPVAILALQRLRELRMQGLDMHTTMLTGADNDSQQAVQHDPSAHDGRPTIAHYIRKILLVSDNDAFNRLYEFLGQEYINNTLHKMGYEDARIIHRLSISLTDEQNRHSNPIRFVDTNGRVIYEQGGIKSNLVYAPLDVKMGKGFMRGDKLINEPFDFSLKNKLSLEDLHAIVRSIFFPQAVPASQRFNLTNDDYAFLRKYMSMRPGESASPVYSQPEYWDNYIKLLYYGNEKTVPDTNIRIFNKTGTAYGFLIDAAYIVDFKNKIEFILSAVIYCNSDGIFNDDKYDYENVGYPFLKNLGRIIYDYELQRKKINLPDLSSIQFDYQ